MNEAAPGTLAGGEEDRPPRGSSPPLTPTEPANIVLDMPPSAPTPWEVSIRPRDVGPHTLGSLNPTTGPLDAAGLSILVNQQAFVPGDTITLQVGVEYQIILRSNNSTTPFQGHLLRIGGPDPTAIRPGMNSATAPACTSDGVGGINHVSPLNKTQAGGTLFFSQASPWVPLDVTVVV